MKEHDWHIPGMDLIPSPDFRPPKGMTYPLKCRYCGVEALWAWDHTLEQATKWFLTATRTPSDCNESFIRRIHDR